MDLFETAASGQGPLADRLRPSQIREIVGQSHIEKILSPYLEKSTTTTWPNFILWGPPGCGKTSLARVIAENATAEFVSLNAVETGAKQIRELGASAHARKVSGLGRTIVFIDEIHRLNRGQQDVLLPFTEAGDFSLIGATTENPSYELNSALLSRCRVLTLHRLSNESLRTIFVRGCEALKVDPDTFLSPSGLDSFIAWVDGDARKLLAALESLHNHVGVAAQPLGPAALAEILQAPTLRYDKTKDEHHDTISAFIKSVRGSDPQAGIYYLARMLAGGEDPVFIARRLVILASEDVGNADPRALSLAISGLQAVELVGMPEASICLAQVVTYLCCAPKSNSSYAAIKQAQAVVEKTGTLPIPLSLRSAKTQLSKQLGYGVEYKYAHTGPTGWQDMEFLPKELKSIRFYEPTDRGFEKTMRQYLNWMTQSREEKD